MTSLFPEDQIKFSHPIFRNVTHLNLVWCQKVGSPKDEVKLDTLRKLKNLTHLSLGPAFVLEGMFSKWVGTIVSLGPESLRVFIFWISKPWYFSEKSQFLDDIKAIYEGRVDMRVVIGSMGSQPVGKYAFERSKEDVLRDRAGIPDGKDFWALAESMIEERRRRIAL
ncbi:hypothetical protein H1R20_g9986, partial [Candolleomyces eurysporus]